MASFIAIAG